MSPLRTICTAVAAGAAGACVALLYAPQSGARTRRQIRRKAEDYRQILEDGICSCTEDARQRLGAVQERIEEVRSRLTPRTLASTFSR